MSTAKKSANPPSPDNPQPRTDMPAAPTDDKRLERLYDYTKFHIGIYLSAAAALASLLSAAAPKDASTPSLPAFFLDLVGSPQLLFASLLLMILAGAAGGIVATSITESRTFDDFWTKKQGPFGIYFLTGRKWVSAEHGCFWLSLLCILLCVLTKAKTLHWMLGLH
jgi:hypothetical protein